MHAALNMLASYDMRWKKNRELPCPYTVFSLGLEIIIRVLKHIDVRVSDKVVVFACTVCLRSKCFTIWGAIT